MSGPGLQSPSPESAHEALTRRAEQILRTRPAYREVVNFYLTVFRRQIEWRNKLGVRPESLDREQVRRCLGASTPLAEHHDPGIAAGSLQACWAEMKDVFRRGNAVLEEAVGKIDAAEQGGGFVPGAWLLEQRPDRGGLVPEAAARMGVDESVLATLTRAVTFPHWRWVAQNWLPDSGRLPEWQRFQCPTCGGPPGLVELRAERPAEANLTATPRRFMHCPFCGSRWQVPDMKCPACGSTKTGDAKYLFTTAEPELRVEYCASCRRYVKVVDTDKIAAEVHVGLELLTTAHLDTLAQEKELTPL